jgi:hypothetical protein
MNEFSMSESDLVSGGRRAVSDDATCCAAVGAAAGRDERRIGNLRWVARAP